jgi:hypothetical protein
MKNLFLILAAFLLTGGTALAETTTTTSAKNIDHVNRLYKGYGNSFIFVEQGIEFAVFPDGQFDFNVNTYGPNFGAHVNLGNVSISFNTGYSYDAYVQYDDYGAVIQIENIPIYYDYYGRITQAGNVHISYNRFGRIYRIGGLYVHYNRYNRYSHYTGYINVYNRHYVYRPWHNYYVIPSVNYCVVYHRPYRQYYAPVRYNYHRPYRNNSRPRSQVSYTSGRRTSVAQNTARRGDIYRENSEISRRDQLARTERTDRRISKRAEPTNSNVSRPPITSPGDRPSVRPNNQQTRPMIKNRGDKNVKVKPKVNKTRPTVVRSDNHKKKKRVAMSSKTQQRKAQSKSVNSNKKHKTKSVTKRSQKRNPSVMKRSKSKNNKSRASGSSSKKQRSSTKRSRQ